ncbi:hypothetical protein GLOIN_2v1480211 [Rhizophagus clarus]|uniref:Uncharacterized protein n=1 Tax=Rhizophagus clarus TaxID=94130 RepID=A0A8H3QRV6_9GLOM|nr:hypothetical protein GLOIN_2v1480211 [Rhizophagus clarus]
MEPSQSAHTEVNTENKIIYKPKNKYNLQETVGLKNEKQRWLSYLETMRESLYERNVDFNSTSDFPVTSEDWAIKDILITTIQNKRYYLKKKKVDLENKSRESLSPIRPLEPHNNQENWKPL